MTEEASKSAAERPQIYQVMVLHYLLAILCTTGLLVAADVYVTPEGAGVRDGSGWEAAFGKRSIDRVVNEVLLPGDTLFLGGGVYEDVRIVVRRGGAEGRPTVIRGVDRGEGLPVLRGQWTVEDPSKGATAIRFAAGVSDVLIADLRIERVQVGVRVPHEAGSALNERLSFRNVDMSRIRHGFYLAGCRELLLEDCALTKYTKHGFRFDEGCSQVRVVGCVADCSGGSEAWEKKTELFPFGFLVNRSTERQGDFRFVDCLARNNRMPLQDRTYKNGDGFVVEESADRVAFVRCRAIRNQDGGFDLKTREVSLEGCVAVENSRAFRLWGTGRLSNCFAGFGKVGLWSNGGEVAVERSTFYALSGAAVLADDRATGPVTAKRCLVTRCGVPFRRTAKGVVEFEGTPGAEAGGEDVPIVFRNPGAGWRGATNEMDSISHPDVGYVFAPAKEGP